MTTIPHIIPQFPQLHIPETGHDVSRVCDSQAVR